MSSELFLLEIFLNRISVFNPPQPSRKSFKVECSFGTYNFVIDSSVFDEDEINDDVDEDLIIRAGKSFLFSSKTQTLVIVMGQPLQLKFYDRGNYLGFTQIPWSDNFLDLIQLSATTGSVRPAKMENQFKIFSTEAKYIGSVDMFLRLSSFGDMIETFYYVKKDASTFMFGNENSMKILKCSKKDSKILPLSPLYNPTSRYPEKDRSYSGIISAFGGGSDSGSLVSAVSLDSGRRDFKFMDLHNMVHDAMNEMDVDAVVQVELTADKVNRLICNKQHCPVASKFAKYGIGPRATGKGLGTVYKKVKPPVLYGLSQTYGTMSNYGPFGLLEEDVVEEIIAEDPGDDEYDEPTHCHECSNNTSTATLCSDCEIKYPMTVCCDPYNKDPKPPLNSNKDFLKIACLTAEPLRLTGGGSEEDEPTCCPRCSMESLDSHFKFKYPMDVYGRTLRSQQQDLKLTEQLRLIGGGPSSRTSNKKKQIPNPFFDCDVTLRQFDKIIKDFKSTRASCGMTFCPLAENTRKERCKSVCELPYSPDNIDLFSCLSLDCPYTNSLYASPANAAEKKDLNVNITCQDVECPLQDPHEYFVQKKFKDDQVRPACASPDCPYKKYKATLIGPDLQVNANFLPKDNMGTCGHPSCEYDMEKELPPIHWDCPDPLPKDKCKNPNCPYGVTLSNVPKNPCGNNDCPYTLPPPCELPSCPFRERPCPYKKKKCVTNLDEDCDDPECAFNSTVLPCCPKEEDIGKPLTDLPCCGNPNCPLTSARAAKLNPKTEKCYNIDCPFTAAAEKENFQLDPCEPVEPYACGESPPVQCGEPKEPQKVDLCICGQPLTCQDDAELCDNPSCPTNIPCGDRNKSNICNNPECLYNRDDDCLDCPNPYCPRNDKFIIDSCTSKECPYNIEKRRKNRLKEKLCNNKKCKFFETFYPDLVGEGEEGDEGGTCKPTCGDQVVQKKKIKVKGKYVYSIGDTFPGMSIGHKACVPKRVNVPSYMGWLWNKPMAGFRPRKGWVPGAIGKTVAQHIRKHWQSQGLGVLRLPIFSKAGGLISMNEVNVVPRPTLQIKKKNGTYYVTLNPLKDPNTLVPNEDPYMNCSPLTFQITKSVKNTEGCLCDEEESSNSDMDIEFTPPAGLINPERFKKLYNVVHCCTQYDMKDLEKKTKSKKGKKDKKGKKGKKDKKKGDKDGDKKKKK